MRLGGQDVAITSGSFAEQLFASTHVRERFRHRYEVEPKYIEELTNAGLIFSGHHPEHQIMQMLELPSSMHPYFVAGQFHPELTSRPLNPQPMFMGLVFVSALSTLPYNSILNACDVNFGSEAISVFLISVIT